MKVTYWAVLCAATAMLTPRPSDACGGFFCGPPPDDPDLPRPVYQTGELVLFVEGPDEVEAHIQIQYAGVANDFSWVVPVQVVPEIDFGSDEAFFALAGGTAPVYASTQSSHDCPRCLPCYAGDADADTDGDTDGDTDYDSDSGTGSGGGGVQIIDSGIVGPFETVTLASDDTTALTTWLSDNGYDIPDTAFPIIDSYVAANFYFVGLKLTKDAETGDLRPIVLRMQGAGLTPCVPLRLTAIAAAQDMPVRVWTLADDRAVSTNFQEVVPNDFFLHFPQGTETPDEILAAAIDEAGGRGFAVDYAGDDGFFDVAMDTRRYDTDSLATLDDPVAFVDGMTAQGFTQSRLVLSLLREFIPRPASVPAEVDDSTFYECLDCDDPGCVDCYEDDIAGQPFDPVAFAAALQENVVRPISDLSNLAATRSYLTALRSVISPGEMTEDPEFAFRSDLPRVGRVRSASRTIECQGSILPDDDYDSYVTPEGIRADRNRTGVIPPSYRSMPSLLRSFVRDGEGDELSLEQTDEIEAALSTSIPDPIALADDTACECGRSDGRDGGGDADADADTDSDGDGDAAVNTGGGSLCAMAPGRAGPGGVLCVAIALGFAVARRKT